MDKKEEHIIDKMEDLEDKLNDVQKKITNRYRKEGFVFAMCPRLSGKTMALFYIAYKEIKDGNDVYFMGLNYAYTRNLVSRFKKLIPDKLKKHVKTTIRPKRDTIVLFDEFFFRQYNTQMKPINFKGLKRFAVVGTYPYDRFVFGFDSYQDDMKKKLIEEKKNLERIGYWNLEFNGGIIYE